MARFTENEILDIHTGKKLYPIPYFPNYLIDKNASKLCTRQSAANTDHLHENDLEGSTTIETNLI